MNLASITVISSSDTLHIYSEIRINYMLYTRNVYQSGGERDRKSIDCCAHN